MIGPCQRISNTNCKEFSPSRRKGRGLKWDASSGRARRGFCQTCGAGLFWEPVDQPGTGILAGTLDQPNGLATIGHIFVAGKCDFTGIAGDAPQIAGSSEGALQGDKP